MFHVFVRFLLRACLHDVKIVSSNKAILKIPVLPFGVNPSSEDNTTARPSTPSTTFDPSSATRSESKSGSDNENDGDGKEKEGGRGEGEAGEESNPGNEVSDANRLRSDETTSAVAAPQVLSEGRTTWKGDTLTALRTPLFVVEIAVVGEKGSEAFAYTQRLSAVKESALALIDKAIASTQVN